ncbi:hypothetical protein QZH41_006156 [Actinostola sp. cb2023]|nr:hypothetical protein QZH41_003785 [Actinostola sp. cb2023]KAK3755099.1 hypothetical protein QZH41_006156 [Actinostola sp. cb2023]
MSSKLLLVVLLIICIVAHFDGVNGACSEEHQHTEVQKCEKAFVDAMAKNANVNCSVELNKVHNCLTTLSKECYPKVNEKMIKQLVTIAMKQFQAMEFYCSKSNNITATWSNIAPAIRDRLPCYARAITNETSYKCSKGFRTDLHKTPKDSEAIYR